MTRRIPLGAGIAALVLVAAGCGARVPPAIVLASTPAEVEQLDLGRTLYLTRCGGCHSIVEPRAVEPADWPEEVRSMTKRAKITRDQAALILAYLVKASVYREPPPP